MLKKLFSHDGKGVGGGEGAENGLIIWIYKGFCKRPFCGLKANLGTHTHTHTPQRNIFQTITSLPLLSSGPPPAQEKTSFEAWKLH